MVVVVLFLAASCAADSTSTPSNDATSGKAEPAATSSPSGEEVFFPRVRPTDGPNAVPSAMGGGELVLDDEGCLRMLLPGEGPESGWVPVWPAGFELDTGDGKVRVLDERGRVVAEVGKRVVMGGGDIEKQALREYRILSERTWRELFERCPPGYSYWLVGKGCVSSDGARAVPGIFLAKCQVCPVGRFSQDRAVRGRDSERRGSGYRLMAVARS